MPVKPSVGSGIVVLALLVAAELCVASGCESVEEYQDRCQDTKISCWYDCSDELSSTDELTDSFDCSRPACQGDEYLGMPVMPCCTSCCDAWWECYSGC